MDSFEEISKYYVANFATFSIGKHEFDSICGSLTFIKDKSNDIILFEIYVKYELRNKCICKSFLSYLIDLMETLNIKTLRIVSVLSNILYDFLERWNYKNKKWKRTKIGFHYICC